MRKVIFGQNYFGKISEQIFNKPPRVRCIFSDSNLFRILLKLKPIIKWSKPPIVIVPINANAQNAKGQDCPISAKENTATKDIKNKTLRACLFLFNHL